MSQSLAHIALIVRDYDEAIAWITSSSSRFAPTSITLPLQPPSAAGSQRLMSLTMPLVEGFDAFFFGLSAFGLRASLFDFF